MKHVPFIYSLFLNQCSPACPADNTHVTQKKIRFHCIVPGDVMTCFVQLLRRWLSTQIEAMRSKVGFQVSLWQIEVVLRGTLVCARVCALLCLVL